MRWAPRFTLLGLLYFIALPADAAPFGIQVVDEETGRGVPMVELVTVSNVRFITDSAGLASIDDPALANQKVFFSVSSLGYEYPADGFGSRGKAFHITTDQIETIKLKRLNVAERLYRITGEGIYRDSVLLGRRPPIQKPLINANVVGQDSVQSVMYRGKLRFFWGDTSQQAYPLGLFRTAGATADLPDRGGLDPSVGIDLHYFENEKGFARAMVPGKEPGVVWIDGVFTLKDDAGEERLLAHASRLERLGKRLARSLLVYDDTQDAFGELKRLDVETPLSPAGHPLRVSRDGVDYIYFPSPYPAVRVRADWQHATDVTTYEAFTPLKPAARYADTGDEFLDRNAKGQVVFTWKRNAVPLEPKQLAALINTGRLKPADCPFRLGSRDGKPVLLHSSSVAWNDYRKKWVMIASEIMGTSLLGEVWYAEAGAPEGPWILATKIVTHHRDGEPGKHVPDVNVDFYNPKHHPFLDQAGGRIIYFEGTYTNSFSRVPTPTPRYEYNQMMYRLDLANERLR